MRKALGFALLCLLCASRGASAHVMTDGNARAGLNVGSSSAADHYQVAAFPNVQVALDAMQGAGASSLPDAGAPFGPGDFTGALQFDFSVAPGGSQPLGILLIPEPATVIQLGLGLFGLAFAGRKRA